MTKRTGRLLSIALGMFCLLSAALSAQPGQAKGQAPGTEKKILIVYLSRTSNTKAIAEMIHDELGGKLVALELQTPYPADYHATVQQVVHENETGYLPPLKTVIDKPDQYDVIFLGFPTWDMKLPPPMKSFLHQYGFRGKAIVPFNSNAGYGAGNTFDTVRELCPQSKVLQGFSTRGGVERDGELLAIKDTRAEEVRKAIHRWLESIGMLKESVSQQQ